MAEQAKITRTELKTQLDTAIMGVNRAIAMNPVNKRTLTVRTEALNNTMLNLTRAHAIYATKALLEDTDADSSPWIEAQRLLFMDAADAAETKLNDMFVDDNPAESIQAEKKQVLDNLQATINSIITTVEGSLGTDIEPSQAEINLLKVKLNDAANMEPNLTNAAKSLRDSDQNNQEALIQAHSTYESEMKQKILQLEIQLARLTPDAETPASRRNDPRQPDSNTPARSNLQIQKTNPPSFDGKAATYAAWKARWNTLMGDKQDVEQLLQLQHSLPSRDWSRIEHFTTMDRVWEILDKSYGKVDIVVNEVLKNVANLKSRETNPDQYVIDLYYLLTKSMHQLEAVKAESHLSSPVKVAEMAKSMPDEEFREYCKQKQSLIGNPWEILMKYLDIRRVSAEEFLQNRPEPSKSGHDSLFCHYCQEKGHMKRNCNKFKKDLKNGTVISRINANATGVMKCFRCEKAKSTPSGGFECPGCKTFWKEEDKIQHCLEHCPRYTIMTPNERAQTVLQHKYCPCCLVPGHTISDCKNKTNDRRICKASGCSKHHHHSLHESTLPAIISINAIQAKLSPVPSPLRFFATMGAPAKKWNDDKG